jgi:hypothetical protein
MSTPFRIDWRAILARFEEVGGEPTSFCLVCLPKGGIQLLSAAMERLRWQATYRDSGYTLTDSEWEYLTDILDDMEVGLMNCEIVSTIISEVTNNVTQTIINQTAMEDACCYEDGTGAPPVDIPGSGEPPGGSTEAGERCARAQEAHDGGLEFLQQVLNFASAGGGLTAGVIWIIITTLIAIPPAIPVALIGVIIAAILAIVSEGILDDVLLDWEAIKHDVACCFANSPSAASAKDCIHDVIDTSVEGAVTRTLFKAIFSQAQVNKVWDGVDYTGAGYDTEYCDDCEGEPAIQEVWGVGFTVESLTTDHITPSNAGIGWSHEILSLSGDLVRVTGHRSNTETPSAVTTYEIVSPTHPVDGGAAAIYEHGATAAATHLKGAIGVWNGGSPRNYDALLSTWRLLARPVGSTSEPTWQDAEIVAMGDAPAGVTLVGQDLIFDGEYGNGISAPKLTFALT